MKQTDHDRLRRVIVRSATALRLSAPRRNGSCSTTPPRWTVVR